MVQLCLRQSPLVLSVSASSPRRSHVGPINSTLGAALLVSRSRPCAAHLGARVLMVEPAGIEPASGTHPLRHLNPLRQRQARDCTAISGGKSRSRTRPLAQRPVFETGVPPLAPLNPCLARRGSLELPTLSSTGRRSTAELTPLESWGETGNRTLAGRFTADRAATTPETPQAATLPQRAKRVQLPPVRARLAGPAHCQPFEPAVRRARPGVLPPADARAVHSSPAA